MMKIISQRKATINNIIEETNKRLISDSRLDTEEILRKYSSSLCGMTEEDRKISLEKYGSNKIEKAKNISLLKRLSSAFLDPFTLILVLLSIISLFTDYVFASLEDKNFLTPLIILLMVILSGVLRFTQETKSYKTSSKLTEMIETTCLVFKKDKPEYEMPIDKLVVGDIVKLSSGDMIPADIRILTCKDLFISEGTLTGESQPVEKLSINKNSNDQILSITNLSFMGTNVISGSAIGIVLATGNKTIFGNIAMSVNSNREPSHFEKGLNSVSMVLIKFMMIMVPIVFLITGFTKGHWINSLIFAISIAVGLTPEMLPMIVTSCLSVGSIEMAKKKVIIKNLNSIQSLGAMNILCTDKTGTLTEDHIVLQRHLNINGLEDTKVLRYGFLNSYYQTGLKNLMDKAIISKTKELMEKDENLEKNIDKFEKIDEIPFDFERRRMSVLVRGNTKVKLITKGAVEEILSISKFVEINNQILPISDEIKEKVFNNVNKLNSEGMRVIAVAYKVQGTPIKNISLEDENNMILIGYLSFFDPPKASAISAIKDLKEYGIAVKVLTGDSKEIAINVCNQLKIDTTNVLTGELIEKMSDLELKQELANTTIFSKLSPIQKMKIVKLLKKEGNVVGFMGDGINDAAALESADVGISVSNAVDIAKEAADAILLEKDLSVLKDGIIQGRKIYANMLKYIKVTASSNFGNVFSILIASIFLPFLPMQPLHLLMLNMIYDISCIAFPWDNVDESFLKEPKTWNADSIPSFMIRFGPISSLFDIVTYILLYFLICPIFTDGVLYKELINPNLKDTYIAIFNSGWFIESMLSQTLVIHMLRTSKRPFIESNPSKELVTLNILGIVFVIGLTYSKLGLKFGFHYLPIVYFAYLFLIILLYLLLVTFTKNRYLKQHKEIL